MSISLNIEKYSHGCRVTGFDADSLHKTTRFLETLSLKEPGRVNNRPAMVLKKKYYGMTENKRELFIHRNSLPEFVGYLSESGYPTAKIVYNQIPIPSAVTADYLIDDKYVLREYQVPIVDELSDDMYTRRLDLQTGKGKLQPLDAAIKTPGGWTTMGALKIGDTITAWDGTPTKVIGVYPHGKKPIYKVTFADGRSTEAGPEHLWRVYYINTQPHKRWRIVDTMEMIRLISMPNPRVYVQLIESEDAPDIELPIDPYTLGVILGDGSSVNGLNVTKLDDHVFDRIAEVFPDNLFWKKKDHKTRNIVSTEGYGSNQYINALKEMELKGKRSWMKFIPDQYLLNPSRNQRLALLQGLMDTDGTANTLATGGAISFNSTSYRLATGVQYLVRSLGGIASISVRQTQFTHKGVKKNGRDSYDVNIRYKKPSELFSLPRKKERTNDDNQYAKDLKLRVKSIKYVGMKEAQCISVDHPDRLYVTDDFIVTHNTFTTLAALARMGCRAVVMVPPKYFGIWRTALLETYGDRTKWREVSGGGELKQLIMDGLEGNIHEDVIIISCVSYRIYIEAYETYGENIEASGYMCAPPRFHEVIGAGMQINDEFQEDPGLYFRIDVYSNVAKQVYLSATPYTGNAYVTKMIDIMTPPETRCKIPTWDRYIDVMWLMYSDPTVQPKDYLTPFKNTYNHGRYETQMLKKQRRKDKYFADVYRAIEGLYVRDRKPGQKALVLCYTVAFIHELTEFLRERFPDLKINFHVSGCDYKKIQDNDITISTPKSAGTGVDIPNLRETFLLVATGSEKDCVQIMGRTRPLKGWPDVTPRLTVLVCNNIPQHGRYMAANQEVFAKKARFQKIARL